MAGLLSKFWGFLGLEDEERPAPKKAVLVYIFPKCMVTMKTIIRVRSSDWGIYAFEYNDKDLKFSQHRCECNGMKQKEYDNMLEEIEKAYRRQVEMDRECEELTNKKEGSESGDEEESEQSEDSEDDVSDDSDLEDSEESGKYVPVFVASKCMVTSKTIISVRNSDMSIYAFEFNDKDVKNFSYHHCKCNTMKMEEYEKLHKKLECMVTMKTIISVRSSDLKVYAFEFKDENMKSFSYHHCKCNTMKMEEYEKLLQELEEADRRRVEVDRECEELMNKKEEEKDPESGDEELSDGGESEPDSEDSMSEGTESEDEEESGGSESEQDSEDDVSSEAGSDLEDSEESDSEESVVSDSGSEGKRQDQVQLGHPEDPLQNPEPKRNELYESDSENEIIFMDDDFEITKTKRSFPSRKAMAYRPSYDFGQNKQIPFDDGCDDRDFISAEVQKSCSSNYSNPEPNIEDAEKEEEVITSIAQPIQREKFFVNGREADDLDYVIRDYKEMLARKQKESDEALEASMASNVKALEELEVKIQVDEPKVAQHETFAEKFRSFMEEVHLENQKRNQQLLEVLKTFQKN